VALIGDSQVPYGAIFVMDLPDITSGSALVSRG
jgi:hypothetical protein